MTPATVNLPICQAFGIGDGRFSGIDAVIHPIGRGLGNIVNLSPGYQTCRLHDPTQVVDGSTGNVDLRAGLHDDGIPGNEA